MFLRKWWQRNEERRAVTGGSWKFRRPCKHNSNTETLHTCDVDYCCRTLTELYIVTMHYGLMPYSTVLHVSGPYHIFWMTSNDNEIKTQYKWTPNVSSTFTVSYISGYINCRFVWNARAQTTIFCSSLYYRQLSCETLDYSGTLFYAIYYTVRTGPRTPIHAYSPFTECDCHVDVSRPFQMMWNGVNVCGHIVSPHYTLRSVRTVPWAVLFVREMLRHRLSSFTWQPLHFPPLKRKLVILYIHTHEYIWFRRE